jgi:hypothetical protein
VPGPRFDDYDEHLAEAVVKAHEAADPTRSINGLLARMAGEGTGEPPVHGVLAP